MASLSSQLRFTQVQEFMDRLGRAGLTPADVEALLKHDERDESSKWAFDSSADQLRQNPFALSVEEQISRFMAANLSGDWGFTQADFDRLAGQGSLWPHGYYSFRSLRIRLGHGRQGVEQTMRAHFAEIMRVRDPDFSQAKGRKVSEAHESLAKRWCLFAGDETHKPGVEWIEFTIDRPSDDYLARNRTERSLADELLVAAWMFPELFINGYPRQNDGYCFRGFFPAGYIKRDIRDKRDDFGMFFRCGGNVSMIEQHPINGSSIPELLW